jgi:flagellar protein FlgJ
MDELFTKIPSNTSAVLKKEGRTLDPEQDKKLKKACADFEAMMVFQLLKTMRQTIPQNGLLKSSQGKETYEMLMDQKISNDLASKGQGMGLQKILYNQITSQNFKKD